jgi:hypothetical protein
MRKHLLLSLVVLFLLCFAAAAFAAPAPAAHVPNSAAAFFQSLNAIGTPAPARVPSQGLDALLGKQSPTAATCHACFDPPLDCNEYCTCGGSEFCMPSGCSMCSCDLCW